MKGAKSVWVLSFCFALMTNLYHQIPNLLYVDSNSALSEHSFAAVDVLLHGVPLELTVSEYLFSHLHQGMVVVYVIM